MRSTSMRPSLALCAALSCAACSKDEPARVSAALTSTAPVTTQHNDIARTGAKLDETQLTPLTVKPGAFGRLFSRAVDGQLYAQPLWMPSVQIAGVVRNVVYVATEHNSVYAFDADDPAAAAPLWHISAGTPPTSNELSCGNVSPEVGVTSTPVIDPATSTLYFVAKSKSSGQYFHRLHAVDLRSGEERPGSPVTLSASVGGVTFNAFDQLQRPGLLLVGGVVYIAFGSHCDNGNYHGWVLGYDAATLLETAAYNTTPDAVAGAIWSSGQGPASDGTHLFVMTGNGSFTADGRNLSDSFVELGLRLDVADWFTPFNQVDLDAQDLDLGSTGPLLLPGTNLVAGVGKEGTLYVLDRGNMGHFNAGGDTQIVQSFHVTSFPFGSPVFWNGRLYLAASKDPVRAYAFDGRRFNPTPVATSGTAAPWTGGMLSISADGTQAGSGIVWELSSLSQNAFDTPVAGVLRALDARSLAELWSSAHDPADDLGSYNKFTPPTIANGHVYAATSSGKLQVYGLFAPPPPPPPPDAGVDASVPPPDGGASGVLFSDDFNRQIPPDEGLGAPWILTGAWYTDGRAVTDQTRPERAAIGGASCRDCSMQASVIGFGVPELGVFVRAQTSAADDRYDLVRISSGDVQLRRARSGVVTVLAQGPSGAGGLDEPATLTLSATGTSPVALTASVNGVVRLTASDGSAAALGDAGMAGLLSGSAGVVFDNALLTGSGGPPPPPPPPPPDLTSGPADMSMPPSGVLFSDGFNRQIAPDGGLGAGWLGVTGHWYTDGRAISDASSGNQAAATAATCGDCTVRASVLGFGVPEVGVYLRAPQAGSRDRYDVVLTGAGALVLRRVRGGVVTILGQAPSGLAELDLPATVSLSASGAGPVTLTVELNGVQILTVTDASAAALTGAGYAGLETSNAGVVFDDFALTAL